MAKVYDFQQTSEQYRLRSEKASRRGIRMKSLFYAKKSAEIGGISGIIRFAETLYECGNFEDAADKFLELYFGGEKSHEVYAGLCRCFFYMSYYPAADFFLREGAANHAFDEYFDGEFCEDFITDVMSALAENTQNNMEAVEAGRYLFPVLKMLNVGSEGFFQNAVGGDSPLIVMGAEVFDEVLSAYVGYGLDTQTASVTLDGCNDKLATEPDNIQAMTMKVQALVALGRHDEALTAANYILSSEVPGYEVDILKCALALWSVGNYNGVIRYISELLSVTNDKRILLIFAFACIGAGEREKGREQLVEVLKIDERNAVANYYLKMLDDNNDILRHMPELFMFPGGIVKLMQDKILHTLMEMSEKGLDALNGCADLMEWALTGNDEHFAGTLGVILISADVKTDFIVSKLRSCAISADVKVMWLAELLFKNANKQFTVFVRCPLQIACELDIECSPKARQIYCLTLSTLAVFFGEDVQPILKASFVIALPELEKRVTRIHAEAAAAAIAFDTKIEGVKTISEVTRIFAAGYKSVSDLHKTLFGGRK